MSVPRRAGLRVPWVVVPGVVVALAAPWLLAVAFAGDPGQAWSRSVDAAVQPWEDGAWRVLRGGLKWIMPPALLAGVLVGFAVLLRRSGRGRAVLAAVAAAGGFGATEAIKWGIVPFPGYGPDGDHPLSGHAATAASALAFALVAVPAHRRVAAGVGGAVLVVGAEVGTVLARWHDAGDVVIPVVVSAGALAVVGAAAQPRPDTGSPASWGRRDAALAAVVVCAGAAAAIVAPGVSARTTTLSAVGLAAVAAAALLTAVGLRTGAAIDSRYSPRCSTEDRTGARRAPRHDAQREVSP